MKKKYIAPQSAPESMYAEMMLAASVAGVGGNSGITVADENEEVPTEGEVKDGGFFEGGFFDINIFE